MHGSRFGGNGKNTHLGLEPVLIQNIPNARPVFGLCHSAWIVLQDELGVVVRLRGRCKK